MYGSVSVLGGAIRTDIVPQCIMKACKAGRLKFSASFVQLLSAIFDIQIQRSRKTHELIV